MRSAAYQVELAGSDAKGGLLDRTRKIRRQVAQELGIVQITLTEPMPREWRLGEELSTRLGIAVHGFVVWLNRPTAEGGAYRNASGIVATAGVAFFASSRLFDAFGTWEVFIGGVLLHADRD